MILSKFYLIKGLLIFVFFISIIACKKQPGTGGVAQITGNVYADTIFENKNNKVLGSGYLASIAVYLCYDKDTIASQSTKTSYNGAYKFDYLQKGNYSVYV
ncbi:MAG: SdrD B-like domain, partial [Bacteroidota bacterium]